MSDEPSGRKLPVDIDPQVRRILVRALATAALSLATQEHESKRSEPVSAKDGSRSDDLPQILSTRKVMEITGLSAATLWRMRRRGEFPNPIRISHGRVGWPASVIGLWLASRKQEN